MAATIAPPSGQKNQKVNQNDSKEQMTSKESKEFQIKLNVDDNSNYD